jgi:uncharacterized membrane protein
LLSYLLGLITGIIFFLIEKKNKFVRFHAVQSMLVSVTIFILNIIFSIIPGVGNILVNFLFLAGLILWVVLMVKAYQGEMFKLPVIGELADQKA